MRGKPVPGTLSPDKREQILSGARTVFAAEGYEGASMARIALAAGVSKGTLYNHFADKEALFRAFVTGQCRANLQNVFELPDEDGDPRDVLHRLGMRFLQMITSPAGLIIFRIVVAEAGKFPSLARIFFDAGPAKGYQALAAWLRRQTGRGHFDIDDAEFAAEQFLTLCQTRLAMRRMLHLIEQPDTDEMARVVGHAITMFLQTYAVRKPG